MLKPPFEFLQPERYLLVVYIDKRYLQSDSFTECAENVIRIKTIIGNSRFLHWDRQTKNNITTRN